MKKFTQLLFCVFAVFTLCVTSAIAQSTFTDNFGTAHNYITDGVTSTIWDGLKLNDGFVPDVDTAEITALNTTKKSGALTFSTDHSNWSTENDNGAFLYKNLYAADADFDCKVQITDGDFLSFGNAAVTYLMVGITARRTDSLGFVAVQAFDRPGWGAVYGLRDIPMDPQENWVWGINNGVCVLQGVEDASADTIKISDYPWQRLKKEGDVFTSYMSADGTTWIECLSVTRTDLQGKKLQVGLYNATYTENEGSVVFDDFSLTDNSAPISVGRNLIDNKINVSFISASRSILINAVSQNIDNVKLISIDGKVIDFRSNVNDKRLVMPAPQQTGLYIVLVNSQNGIQTSRKVVVY